MSAIIDFFRGTAQLRLSGAWPEGCLNRFARERIAFWDTTRVDDFTYTVRIYGKDRQRAEKAAQRAQCDCEIEQEFGFQKQFGKLRYRIALLLAGALLLTALCVLPQFIWVIDVQGCETLHEEQVLRALESLGIGFGTWGPSIDSQTVKNHMLVLLPELEWIAVNRSGGRATVLVQERVPSPEVTDRRECANIIASRTGIITEIQVYSGEVLVQKGQTVLRGELLVSGLFDRTTGVQVTHAMAEIYARTWHEHTAVMPSQVLQKQDSGQEKTQFAIVFGHWRINFYRNSGISSYKCAKMTQTSTLTLPGGITLPISLIEETYRAYTVSPADVDAASARDELQSFTRDYVFSGLVGGSITQFRTSLREDNGVYLLDSVAECSEQIALEVPSEPNEG
jgi:similar to stage IV sporulation protein